MQRQDTYTFHVGGMHCKACGVLIEAELKDDGRVASVSPDLGSFSVKVRGDFGGKPPADVARELSLLLSEHTLSTEPQRTKADWGQFGKALPIALGFVLLFVLLQKLGIVNLVNAEEVTYGTAFLIGVVASLSTCMAVVGGLVLSMSATAAHAGKGARSQVIFHAGRIIAFFVLGGVIGAAGSAFQLGATGIFVLGLLVGLVMLVMGINLLDVFPWAKRLQPAMPAFLSRGAFGAAGMDHALAPALVGAATFFLPCGFTQSMQIYSLSTGGFLPGALTMLFFALGTLPALAALSFGSLGIRDAGKKGIFFKSAGLVVIAFALFNIINSFVAIGAIPPVFDL